MDNSPNDWFALMQTVVQYRHQPIVSRLREIRQKHSMLHEDVIILIYHLSKIASGNVLEIGAYLGGSTIAAAIGTREAERARLSVTIEPGGQHKHPRLPSKDILRDLKKNLARNGVADLITIVEGYSGTAESAATVHDRLAKSSVGLLIIDADGEVERDFGLYRDLLMPNCWAVIDDYFNPAHDGKSGRTKPQVDSLVATGELETFGLYGWGTWIGRWRGIA